MYVMDCCPYDTHMYNFGAAKTRAVRAAARLDICTYNKLLLPTHGKR